jgi:hypothetical protein
LRNKDCFDEDCRKAKAERIELDKECCSEKQEVMLGNITNKVEGQAKFEDRRKRRKD